MHERLRYACASVHVRTGMEMERPEAAKLTLLSRILSNIEQKLLAAVLGDQPSD